MDPSLQKIGALIRDVPDFPKPGILFKDIAPVIQDPDAFCEVIRQMGKLAKELGALDKIVAIESRGFIFGSALAYSLGAGMVMVRKPKKLPFRTTKIEYELEYGNDSLEMHIDAIASSDRVLIVDDILATGGTARATAQLVELMGARVQGLLFFAELDFLKGRDRLKGYKVSTVLSL